MKKGEKERDEMHTAPSLKPQRENERQKERDDMRL